MRDSGSKLSLKTLAIAGARIQTGLASLANHASGANEGLGHWAGSRLRRASPGDQARGIDYITLFPGWATREYRHPRNGELDSKTAFDIEIFISGFAYNQKPRELATTSQKAFMRLARGFASIPKSSESGPPEVYQQAKLSRSTEELLAKVQLPPRPTEITEEMEVEALEHQFRQAELSHHHADGTGISDIDAASISSSDQGTSAFPSQPTSPMPFKPAVSPVLADKLTLSDTVRKLHNNLETRLQPFWSSTLSGRVVRLSICIPQASFEKTSSIAAHTLVTDADGSFTARLTVSWEELGKQTSVIRALSGDSPEENNLLIIAELEQPLIQQIPTNPSSTRANINLPLCDAGIRVISDIDDTVKISNILSGARTVFQHVFVKDLNDLVVPGMSEWYQNMWDRGVRFHYVSNGPFELLPVILEFIDISKLPLGSIRLRSYAGRSLFNGLLSAPATRKRAGVLDLLTSFPNSRFILIGDSGEQDLELYAALAAEYPSQVLGIFIRDPTIYDDDGRGVADPTGLKNIEDFFAPLYAVRQKERQELTSRAGSRKRSSRSFDGYFPSSSSLSRLSSASASLSSQGNGSSALTMSADLTEEPQPYGSMPATPQEAEYLSERQTPSTRITHWHNNTNQPKQRPREPTSDSERKRADLQMRIYKARRSIPAHIPFRVFRHPEECVEALELVDKTRFSETLKASQDNGV